MSMISPTLGDTFSEDDIEFGRAEGRATLFFTTFTFTRLPTASSPSLIWEMRRISRRTEGRISGVTGSWFRGCRTSPDLSRSWLMKMQMVFVLEMVAVSFLEPGSSGGPGDPFAVSHFAFQFTFGNQGGNGVDHHHTSRAPERDQAVGNFRPVRHGPAGDQEIVNINPQFWA